jgi:hypothetical protein
MFKFYYSSIGRYYGPLINYMDKRVSFIGSHFFSIYERKGDDEKHLSYDEVMDRFWKILKETQNLPEKPKTQKEDNLETLFKEEWNRWGIEKKNRATNIMEMSKKIDSFCRKFIEENQEIPRTTPDDRKVLGEIFNNCRILDCGNLGIILREFILSKGTTVYISWFDLNVYNKYMEMEWKEHQNYQRLKSILSEMQEFGLNVKNYKTQEILAKIEKDFKNSRPEILEITKKFYS